MHDHPRCCIPREVDPLVEHHARLFAGQAEAILAGLDEGRRGAALARLRAAAAEQIASALQWKLMQPRQGPRFWLRRN